MNVLNKLAEFVGKNLTYIVVAVVVAAFFQPQAFTWAASKTVLLLSVIMFGMGMTLRASDFARFCTRVPASQRCVLRLRRPVHHHAGTGLCAYRCV